MRRIILITLASISFSGLLYAQEPALKDKIQKLNEATIKSIGVSLNALAYLIDASPYSYIPLWHLEESGDIEHIHELEKAGYVKVTIRKGLPDGQMPNEEQVNITPLVLGKKLQRCMTALKHNK